MPLNAFEKEILKASEKHGVNFDSVLEIIRTMRREDEPLFFLIGSGVPEVPDSKFSVIVADDECIRGFDFKVSNTFSITSIPRRQVTNLLFHKMETHIRLMLNASVLGWGILLNCPLERENECLLFNSKLDKYIRQI